MTQSHVAPRSVAGIEGRTAGLHEKNCVPGKKMAVLALDMGPELHCRRVTLVGVCDSSRRSAEAAKRWCITKRESFVGENGE